MTSGAHGLRFADKAVIAVAWLATCGLVYLFGFYLGKGMQEVRYGKEERIVRLPVESEVPPAGSGPARTSSYEFYDNLVGHERGGGGGRAPLAPAPGPGGSVAGPASSVTASPGLPAPTQLTTPPGPAGGPGESPVGTAKPAPTMARSTPGAAQPTPGARPEVSARTHGEGASGGRGWTVRTRPLPSPAEAEALGARLRARGYAARVMQVRRDGKLEYVLVVGRYGTADQAGEVMRRLRTEDGVAQVFVASE